MITNLTWMVLFSFLGLLLTLLVTPLIGKYMRSINKVGRDVHKIDKPEIPESGGIGFMIVYLVILGLGFLVAPDDVSKYRLFIMILILILVTSLGLYDDFKQLSAIKKPLLLVIISAPVFFLREFNNQIIVSPTPILPFIGEAKLYIVYWGLAVFVIAIPSNASNMLDVMNGAMSGSGMLIALTAFIATFIVPLGASALFVGRYASLTLFGVLFGFWWYNRYPAKIFAGDTGSLGAGAAIGLIAIYGEIEFVLVVALLVHIMNSFSILSSIGGLKERREIKERPVTVKNGLIHPSRNPKAPITLVRLLVARKPLNEKEVVNKIHLLVLFSCFLALNTAYLMRFDI